MFQGAMSIISTVPICPVLNALIAEIACPLIASSLMLTRSPVRYASTQIIRHVAKLLDNLCITEIACGRITGPAEPPRPDVPFPTRHHFGPHCGSHRIEAFHRLTGRNTVAGSDERQRNVVRERG